MRPLFTTQARREPPLCSARFAASVLVLIGFFGPWVAHSTAALTVTGYELSEFAKFFPQVQGGAVPVRRALFVTPLFAAAISLALDIHRSRGRPLLRLAGTLLAALLGLSVLPPYQSILEPAYRSQLILVAAGLLLILLTPLTSRFSERIRGALSLLAALLGVIPALGQCVLLRPLVAGLYEARILPGWGLIVCVIGFLLLSLTSLRDTLAS
jgi:hypothetical protein